MNFFRRKLQPVIQPEWMIVGLGNPGPEYRGTRHNVGFQVIDQVAQRNGIKIERGKHRAFIGQGTIGGVPVALVKPLTYMNLSGQAVGPLARSYSLKPNRILVVADDLDLPIGRVKMRLKGSAGGHNGHKSLIQYLGTQEYPRIKIGIGKGRGAPTIDHVLSTFEPEEKSVIEEAEASAAEACERAVSSGIDAALNYLSTLSREPVDEQAGG